MNRIPFNTHMQEVINWVKMNSLGFDVNYVIIALRENIEFLELDHPHSDSIRFLKSMISFLDGHDKNLSVEAGREVSATIVEIIDLEDEEKKKMSGIDCLEKERHLVIFCLLILKAITLNQQQQA